MKTKSFSRATVDHDWFMVDAENKVLGRLATEIAMVLRGKRKPTFTPHADTGDFVVVVNAEKVRLTGRKEEKKTYYWHTGWVGGIKSATVAEIRAKKPEEIIKKAVWGMLPKGPLGREMFKKLKVYAGESHPHEAQKPKALSL